ncbi:MAG: RHS repeat domain-containing protein, partial [Candidatus Thorarchaeota archaeon]
GYNKESEVPKWSRKFGLDSAYRITDYTDNDEGITLNCHIIKPPISPCDPNMSHGQGIIDARIGALVATINDPPSFIYDEIGNRQEVVSEPSYLPYPISSNVLNQYDYVGEDQWTYGPNGELLSDGNYVYDYNNEIGLQVVWEKVIDGGVTSSIPRVTYYRDALGRLIVEKTSDYTCFRVYDQNNPIIELMRRNDGAGFTSKEFTHGHGMKLTHVAFDNKDFWLTSDDSNTLRLVTDHLGYVVSKPRYKPFGQPENNELRKSPISCGYVGMWFTPGFPLFSSRFRSYRPDVGRYIQRDPAGFIDDPNLYTFTRNNPIQFWDPTGLQPIEVHPTDPPLKLKILRWGNDPEQELRLGKYKVPKTIIDFSEQDVRPIISRPPKNEIYFSDQDVPQITSSPPYGSELEELAYKIFCIEGPEEYERWKNSRRAGSSGFNFPFEELKEIPGYLYEFRPTSSSWSVLGFFAGVFVIYDLVSIPSKLADIQVEINDAVAAGRDAWQGRPPRRNPSRTYELFYNRALEVMESSWRAEHKLKQWKRSKVKKSKRPRRRHIPIISDIMNDLLFYGF